MNTEQEIILADKDGGEHVCQVLGVFEFEQQEYALVLNKGEAGSEPSEVPDAVLMKIRTTEGQAVFEMIEDDEEFTIVSDYVKEMVAELDEEDEDDEDEERGF